MRGTEMNNDTVPCLILAVAAVVLSVACVAVLVLALLL